jgi:hypothetical protein
VTAPAPAPSPRRQRAIALLPALPLALVIIAEAAWISVVAGLVQEFTLHPPTTGIASLAAFVATGVIAARVVGPRLGERWPLVGLGLCVAGGVAGWLSSPEARVPLGVGAVGDSLAANPGGWLAALAILRGFAHARLPLSEETIGRLLGAGVPGLAFAAILGGVVAEPFRGQFLADAIVAVITFATTATLALALTRLAAVGADSGFDWRRNPTSVALLAVLVLAAGALAVPASSVTAPAIAFLVGVSIVPLLVIGLVVGFDRRTARLLVIALVAVVALATFMNLIGGPSPATGTDVVPPPEVTASPPDEAIVIGAGLVLVLAALAVILLVRLWMRRIPRVEDDVRETRMIDHGSERPRIGRRESRRRRTAPIDAATAYRALVDELADRPAVRRELGETPAEHARRLRAAGASDLRLDLLAADYALARFAGITLSRFEDRRAVARWRSLRRDLGRHGPGR